MTLLFIVYVLLNYDGEIWGGAVHNWNLELVEFSECSEEVDMSAAVHRGGKEVQKLRWRQKTFE